jgi:hypothetical protein
MRGGRKRIRIASNKLVAKVRIRVDSIDLSSAFIRRRTSGNGLCCLGFSRFVGAFVSWIDPQGVGIRVSERQGRRDATAATAANDARVDRFRICWPSVQTSDSDLAVRKIDRETA